MPGTFTRVGYTIPNDTPIDAWLDAGTMLRAIEGSVMWWIGDWLNFGERAYGEEYTQALDATGYEDGTVRDAKWVSATYDLSDRSDKLSWTHHRFAAGLSSKDRGEVLRQAEENNWSVRKTRLEVTRRQNVVGTFPSGTTCTTADLKRLIDRGEHFGTIYADPPWSYGNQGTRAATGNHYETMAIEDIAALPVAQLALGDAHLHLWTTNAFLFEAKTILEAWGFTYKSCFVWVKTQMGIGNYWRVSHEFLLFGIRGNCPFRDHSQMSWLEIPRSQHSKKPEKVRSIIETVSPGPYLELFGRRAVPGWTVWGNEIERDLLTQDVPEVGNG